MRLDEPAGDPLQEPVPLPAVVEQPIEAMPPKRAHLVVVLTRALTPEDGAEAGATLRARHWHPYEHRWEEADFDSLEALRKRHLAESGWELLQEQRLDAELSVELVFKAHRIDFTRPSREQILRDIGMTPDDVSELLEQVDRPPDPEP